MLLRKYLSKDLKKDGDNNLADLKFKNIFLYQTHDMMLHAKPLIQLGLNLKILEIYRILMI